MAYPECFFGIKILLKFASMKRLNSGFSKGYRVDLAGILSFLRVCLLISVLIVTSCKLDSPDDVIIDNQVDIYYSNILQEDLMDTAVTGSFYADSIHLYNVVKGVKKEVINRADYPHNFVIYKNAELQKYVLRVFLEVDTTFLQLNSHITDTITCVFQRSYTSLIIRKVWYNGNLKWDNYAVSREITIIK